MPRPGKYIEYDFPLFEVNRLAEAESNAKRQRTGAAKKPIYSMHKWWARRLSAVFRSILLATAIDWEDWDRLEPWKRDKDGDFVNGEGRKITDATEYHRRVRDPNRLVHLAKKIGKDTVAPRSAWERLYYRWDAEANAVIGKAFKGRTIFDPFMGGGTTIVEALRLGADAVGIDLNPIAWFVTKKEIDGCDLEDLEKAYRQVEAEVAEEIRAYYKTTCPCCRKQADTMHAFWVKVARCMEKTCQAEVPLFNSFVLARIKGKNESEEAEQEEARDAEEFEEHIPSAGDGIPRNRHGKTGMKVVAGSYDGVRFLVCPDCGEVYASKEKLGARERSTCPGCGHRFPLNLRYAYSGKYTCQQPDCGQKHEILAASKEQGRLPVRLYAMELYCPHCHYRGYKRPGRKDLENYRRACHDFGAARDALRLPAQMIPNEGAITKVDHDLEGHGYSHFTDLFNERQLLCLCRLRDAIMKVRTWNAREYLLLAWSKALQYNTMLCRYHATDRQTLEIFAEHAYVPRNTVGEAHVWGAGRGISYRSFVNAVLEGLAWRKEPWDMLMGLDDERWRIVVGDSFNAKPVTLLARTSEDLSPVPLQVFSHVVTDPPYYGNVMYAELADFYYVWLRPLLIRRYPVEFRGEQTRWGWLTPKSEEAVDQASRAASLSDDDLRRQPKERAAIRRGRLHERGLDFLTKDELFFSSVLTRIFTAARERLAGDGLLTFTFHHQQNEAWSSVLRTVLDAGFYVNSVYPVHAEMLSSQHIRDKANISYDAVIVCRKQTDRPEQASWQEMSDVIYLKAERLVKELTENGRRQNGPVFRLPPEDVYVVVIGKCIEEYSRHCYQGQSYVYHGGRQVSIEDALNGNPERGVRGIGEIVDQLVEEAEGRLWPPGLDAVSRFYAVNFLGQSDVQYDRLKRRLMHNPRVTLEALERHRLIRSAGSKVKVLSEAEREEYLMALHTGEGSDQVTLPGLDGTRNRLAQVDKLHLLYLFDRKGVLAGNLVQDWASDATFVDFARRVATYLDPKSQASATYKRIADALSGTRTQRML